MVRLVSQNTVEEDILKCAQKKLKLEQDMTVGGIYMYMHDVCIHTSIVSGGTCCLLDKKSDFCRIRPKGLRMLFIAKSQF